MDKGKIFLFSIIIVVSFVIIYIIYNYYKNKSTNLVNNENKSTNLVNNENKSIGINMKNFENTKWYIDIKHIKKMENITFTIKLEKFNENKFNENHLESIIKFVKDKTNIKDFVPKIQGDIKCVIDINSYGSNEIIDLNSFWMKSDEKIIILLPKNNDINKINDLDNSDNFEAILILDNNDNRLYMTNENNITENNDYLKIKKIDNTNNDTNKQSDVNNNLDIKQLENTKWNVNIKNTKFGEMIDKTLGMPNIHLNINTDIKFEKINENQNIIDTNNSNILIQKIINNTDIKDFIPKTQGDLKSIFEIFSFGNTQEKIYDGIWMKNDNNIIIFLKKNDSDDINQMIVFNSDNRLYIFENNEIFDLTITKI